MYTLNISLVQHVLGESTVGVSGASNKSDPVPMLPLFETLSYQPHLHAEATGVANHKYLFVFVPKLMLICEALTDTSLTPVASNAELATGAVSLTPQK